MIGEDWTSYQLYPAPGELLCQFRREVPHHVGKWTVADFDEDFDQRLELTPAEEIFLEESR
jgi:hypothetical protein